MTKTYSHTISIDLNKVREQNLKDIESLLKFDKFIILDNEGNVVFNNVNNDKTIFAETKHITK